MGLLQFKWKLKLNNLKNLVPQSLLSISRFNSHCVARGPLNWALSTSQRVPLDGAIKTLEHVTQG